MKQASASPANGIYTQLPEDEGQNYRLKQISELNYRLEKECDSRKSLYRFTKITGVEST